MRYPLQISHSVATASIFMRLGNSSWVRIASGLVLLVQVCACNGADRSPPIAAAAVGSAAPVSSGVEPTRSLAVLGSWARQASECQRPELVFKATSAAIQTDADGQSVAFVYEGASYSDDGSSLVTVELGKPHPYGKTSSKTALTFRLDTADQIALAQAKRFVPFQRCGKALP
jgi:hypothetical protein